MSAERSHMVTTWRPCDCRDVYQRTIEEIAQQLLGERRMGRNRHSVDKIYRLARLQAEGEINRTINLEREQNGIELVDLASTQGPRQFPLNPSISTDHV